MKKKVLAIVLTFCMMLSLIPVSYAEEEASMTTGAKVETVMEKVSNDLDKGKEEKAQKVLNEAMGDEKKSELTLTDEEQDRPLTDFVTEDKAEQVEELLDEVEDSSSEPAEEATEEKEESATEEEPATEEESATEEEPAAEEEQPATEEEPAAEEEPASEEEQPATEEEPAAEEEPAEETTEEEETTIGEVIEEVEEAIEEGETDVAKMIADILSEPFDLEIAYATLKELENAGDEEGAQQFLQAIYERSEDDFNALMEYYDTIEEEEAIAAAEVATVNVTNPAPYLDADEMGDAVTQVIEEEVIPTIVQNMPVLTQTAPVMFSSMSLEASEEENGLSNLLQEGILLNQTEVQTPDPLDPKDDDGDGLYLDKEVTPQGGDTYRLSMGAFVTGDYTVETISYPTDIVLVLDQSGSMAENDYPSGVQYVLCTDDMDNGDMYWQSRNGGVYYKISETEYRPITISRSWDGPFTRVYTYSWQDASGETITVKNTGSGSSMPSALRTHAYSKNAEGTVTRRAALINAATEFINSVQAKATDTCDHRIAVVGFANTGSRYGNTELLSTENAVKYNEATESDYENALVDMTDSDKVAARLTTGGSSALNRLDADGATWVNHGLEMAEKIFENAPAGKVEQERKQVVIVLTDGAPGDYSDWDDDTAAKCASASYDVADEMKGAGVKIYTVGVFDGADATSAGDSRRYASQNEQSNYFMQNLSSNEGVPQDPSFYLSAGDSAALNEIFQNLSILVCEPAKSLGSSSAMQDVVSKYFTFPVYGELPDAEAALDIKCYSVPCTGGDPATGEYTFETDRNKWNPLDLEVWTDFDTDPGTSGEIHYYVINEADENERKEVWITGFDYSSNTNCVGFDPSGNVHGNMLVLEFNVERRAGFWGGNQVPTNNGGGLYERDKDGTLISAGEFPEPYVDLPIQGTISDNGVYANLYYGNGANKGDLVFPVDIAGDSEAWMTEFVNFTINVDTDDVNKAIIAGNESLGSINVLVSPTTEGTYGSVEYKDAVALKAHYFLPEFTIQAKDRQEVAEAATVIDLYTECTLEEAVVWKYKTQTSADTGLVMSNAEPSIAKTYQYTRKTGSGTVEGHNFTAGTTSDFTIDSITVTIGEGEFVKGPIVYEDGSGTLTVYPDPNTGDDHDFTVTVNDPVTGTLVITKKGLHTGESAIFVIEGSGVTLTVTILGDENPFQTLTIREVPIGTYTVTEKNWSWKYNDNGKSTPQSYWENSVDEGKNMNPVVLEGQETKLTVVNEYNPQSGGINDEGHALNHFGRAS